VDLTLWGPRLVDADVNVSIHLCAERHVANWLAGLQPFGDVLLGIHVCCTVMENGDCCVVDLTDIRAWRLSCVFKNGILEFREVVSPTYRHWGLHVEVPVTMTYF
jgi:hypothetical protein